MSKYNIDNGKTAIVVKNQTFPIFKHRTVWLELATNFSENEPHFCSSGGATGL